MIVIIFCHVIFTLHQLDELAVTGLAEDGYEYTGEKIVPQLQVSCKGTELSWIFEGESGSDTYDYVVSAVNNTNVYEYSDGSNGPKERLYPTVTVTARQDENGEYKGNYKGSFQMRFQINPRLISAVTASSGSLGLPSLSMAAERSLCSMLNSALLSPV